jgi:hypothetical protein
LITWWTQTMNSTTGKYLLKILDEFIKLSVTYRICNNTIWFFDIPMLSVKMDQFIHGSTDSDRVYTRNRSVTYVKLSARKKGWSFDLKHYHRIFRGSLRSFNLVPYWFYHKGLVVFYTIKKRVLNVDTLFDNTNICCNGH